MSRGMPRLPRPLMDLWDWQSQAACRDVNPELFFSPESERGVANAPARWWPSRSAAPVRSSPNAVSTRSPSGSRTASGGGTTESERDNNTLLPEHRKSA